MVVPFDTSRAPLREQDYEDLVRAVVAARDGDESSWIEWKSQLDLRGEGRVTVVRCILGMANRQPDVAARFCDGRGYLIVGAAPGQLLGIPEEDPADLTNWWTPYLGTDGPRWVSHWVSLDQKTVLVIEVDAPRNGDPIFTARRDFSGKLGDGALYVRRNGATTPPSSAEISALVRRAAGRPVLSGINVLQQNGTNLRPVNFTTEAIEAWLSATAASCLSSLEADEKRRRIREQSAPRKFTVRPRRKDDDSGSLTLDAYEALQARQSAGEQLTPAEQRELDDANEQARQMFENVARMSAGLVTTLPEKRTPEQYQEQVDCYIEALREALTEQLPAAAARHLPPCRFVLTNETVRNIPAVQVIIRLPEEVQAFEYTSADPDLPKPPRPFGPRQVSTLGFAGIPEGISFLPRVGSELYGFRQARPSVDIRSCGRELQFPAVHLRPYETTPLEALLLLVPPVSDLHADWKATSTDLDGVASGTLSLAIGSDLLTIEDALAAIDES